MAAADVLPSVDLGTELPRWITLKENRGFPLHEEVARFLLDFYDAHLQVQGCPLEGMLAQPPQTFLVQIPTGSSELNSLTAGANPALSTDNTSTSQLVQLPQTQQFLASGPVAMVQLPSGCVENVSQLTGTQPQPTISQPHTVDIAQKQEPIMSSSQMDLNAAMTSASTAGSSLGEFPQPSRPSGALPSRPEENQQNDDQNLLSSRTLELMLEKSINHNETSQIVDVSVESSIMPDGVTHVRTINCTAESTGTTNLLPSTVDSLNTRGIVTAGFNTRGNAPVDSNTRANESMAAGSQALIIDPVDASNNIVSITKIYQLAVNQNIEDNTMACHPVPQNVSCDHSTTTDHQKQQKLTQGLNEGIGPNEGIARDGEPVKIINKEQIEVDIQMDKTSPLQDTDSSSTIIVAGKSSKTSKSKPAFYVCDICGKVIGRKDNYTAHLRKHTSIPLVCPQCGRQCASTASLREHIEVRHENKRYECKECQKVFKSNSAFHLHKRRLHQGVVGHKCDICNQPFNERKQLRTHMNKHEGIRPYCCEVCGSCFYSQKDLTAHGRVCIHKETYSCSVCGKVFKWKASLLTHRKSHQGVKYQCEKCGNRYQYLSSLYKHTRLCKHKTS